MSEAKLSAIEEYFLYVGFLVAYWNKTEDEAGLLLTCLIGDEKRAHILTHKMAIAGRLKLIRRLLEQCHEGEDFQSIALSLVDAMNVLRENRNIIIHGTATRLDLARGAIALRTTTGNETKRTFKTQEVRIDDLAEQLDLVISLGKHLKAVRRYAFPDVIPKGLTDLFDGTPTLPGKFPLPDPLPTQESPNSKKR